MKPLHNILSNVSGSSVVLNVCDVNYKHKKWSFWWTYVVAIPWRHVGLQWPLALMILIVLWMKPLHNILRVGSGSSVVLNVCDVIYKQMLVGTTCFICNALNLAAPCTKLFVHAVMMALNGFGQANALLCSQNKKNWKNTCQKASISFTNFSLVIYNSANILYFCTK